MSKALKQVGGFASATVLSRILGLARDVLMFAGFGAGPYLSAYLVAFTLPNLLRRLVGEGALTSAVIPVLSERLESGGKAASFDTLNRVLSRLFLALLFFSILGIGLLIALSLVPGVSNNLPFGKSFFVQTSTNSSRRIIVKSSSVYFGKLSMHALRVKRTPD